MFQIYNSDTVHSSHILDQNFGTGITPEDLIVPTYNFYNSNYFRPWRVCVQNQNFGSSISNGENKLKISLDVQQFRPNEITVKTTKKEVIVEGKHEERADEHGFISRQFVRKYKLPDDCNSDTVVSNLTADGVLIISAPKNCLKDLEDNGRVVPIKMCETCPNFIPSQNQVKGVEMKNETLIQKENSKTDEKIYDQNKLQRMKENQSIKLDGALKPLQENNKSYNESKVECSDEFLQMSAGKIDRSNVTSKSEMSGFSRMSCETMQSKESSFSSSLSIDMKASNEKTAEYINEIISTELKQASENV